MVAFISTGSTQLLVGPASLSSAEQMKVRSSTRATSVGSVRAQNEFGLCASLRRTRVPAATSSSVRRRHSSADPSHHTTRSGVVSAATSWTQASSRGCSVGACSSPGIDVVAVMVTLLTLNADAGTSSSLDLDTTRNVLGVSHIVYVVLSGTNGIRFLYYCAPDCRTGDGVRGDPPCWTRDPPRAVPDRPGPVCPWDTGGCPDACSLGLCG